MKGRILSKYLKPSLLTSTVLIACILLASCGGESKSKDDTDRDLDTIPDRIDNCPAIANLDQVNADNDTFGDACDIDLDGDGILNTEDDFPNNSDQYLDLDGDGLGHTEDDDNDGDGILDVNDNCPYVANADQADSNGLDDATGLGDACELSMLNDTGQEDYGSFPSSNGACSDDENNNLSTIQDCSYGRDKLARDNKLIDDLQKKGMGDSGFDFTRLDSEGIPLADQSNVIGSYCVKDNVTGLTWEKKISGDESTINKQQDMHYWFDEDEAMNAGVVGTQTMPANVGEVQPCVGYKQEDEETWCNTQAFIKRMNDANYCGANDWRLPSIDELTSIIDYGNSDNDTFNNRIALDQNYFNNTQNRNYWTRTNDARLPASAWSINFAYGAFDIEPKSNAWHVRLVRDIKEVTADE